MTKNEFTAFVQKTLEEVVQLAEQRANQPLSRRLKFQWLGSDVIDENIVETIVERVYLGPESIYPCVDIGVGDLAEDGSPIIVANVAGYGPRPFQQNWTGRDGPFVHIIGQPFLERIAGRKVRSGESFGFITPDMKNLNK